MFQHSFIMSHTSVNRVGLTMLSVGLHPAVLSQKASNWAQDISQSCFPDLQIMKIRYRIQLDWPWIEIVNGCPAFSLVLYVTGLI